MGKEVKVAVLGLGHRPRYIVKNLLKDSEYNVKIVSVFDPDMEVARETVKQWEIDEPFYAQDMQAAIDFPGVEWVMVCSPNCFHKEQIIAAFAAGKHVFTEKPLATSIQDCQEIYDAYIKSGKLFATGFVLRYSLLYRKAYELLHSGKFGKLLAVDASENITPDHGGYIMCNWRRHTSMAGPHILEKCCHDLDLIEWFVGDIPSRVAAFGGRDLFKPENRFLEEKYGKNTFMSWWDPHRTETPFTNDTDMKDNMVTVAEFRNNVRVSFTCTMSNMIPERRMLFCCTEGTIKLELYEKKLSYRIMGDGVTHTLDFSGVDGHGGGDSFIMKELYDSMANGTEPKCSGNEGLQSAVYALALEEAANTGKVFDLEPVWKTLGR
jgi:predicted dehydrogenase